VKYRRSVSKLSDSLSQLSSPLPHRSKRGHRVRVA